MNKLNNIFHLTLLTFVVVLGILFFVNYLEIQELKDVSVENLQTSAANIQNPDLKPGYLVSEESLGNLSKLEIEHLIDEKISNLPTPEPDNGMVDKTSPIPVIKEDKSTVYTTLGSASSTTSMEWFTLEDTSTYIDVENDYGKDSYIQFEANLKVEHGNGTAYARLWDDTNKIAVVGSELSAINSESFEYVLSPKLELWQGRNLYKVQIKSLNGYPAYYSSGKIKVSY